jgi:small conductance mechanosensitive channel
VTQGKIFGSAQAGLLLLLAVTAAPPLAAQEAVAEPPAEETAPASDGRSAALLAEVKAADTRLLGIAAEVADADGERLAILRTQFSELVARQGDSLAALLNAIDGDRDAGVDVTLTTQQAEQLLNRSSRVLRSYLEGYEDHLLEEGSKRAAQDLEELLHFEHRMALDKDRLDHLYLALIDLTKEMEARGLPVDDERRFLEANLNRRGGELLEVLRLTKTAVEADRDLLVQDPENERLKTRVFAGEERYDSNKKALLATIHMLRRLDFDYVDLEVRALELTGEVTPEAFEVEVAAGLVERELARLRKYLGENGAEMVVRLLVIAGMVLLTWFLARIARTLTRRAIGRTKVSTSRLLSEMVVKLSGKLVWAVGLVAVLSQLGISVGPLLAGLGIVGLVVGLALQDTLSNFAAGAMILAYRPFDEGDLVETAGVLGKVSDMTLVSTRILTVDHQTLIVPNSKIWGDVIRNLTAQTRRRVDMVFGISYEDEIPKAERVLEEIVASHEKVLADPEPVIKVHTLNDSSVDFIVRPWARTEDYWDVYWDITREVKMRFDREGISIPYPQHDVHLIGPDSAGSE